MTFLQSVVKSGTLTPTQLNLDILLSAAYNSWDSRPSRVVLFLSNAVHLTDLSVDSVMCVACSTLDSTLPLYSHIPNTSPHYQTGWVTRPVLSVVCCCLCGRSAGWRWERSSIECWAVIRVIRTTTVSLTSWRLQSVMRVWRDTSGTTRPRTAWYNDSVCLMLFIALELVTSRPHTAALIPSCASCRIGLIRFLAWWRKWDITDHEKDHLWNDL